MSSTQSISSSGTITFSGLATGIDTSSIVSQLMALERAPEQILTTQKTKMQNQVSAYNQLSSALTSLQSLMVGMNTADTFAAKTASVADSTVAERDRLQLRPGRHSYPQGDLAGPVPDPGFRVIHKFRLCQRHRPEFRDRHNHRSPTRQTPCIPLP